MKTYHITLDNGLTTHMPAQCAADAISKVLWDNRGTRAVRCFQGELGQTRIQGKIYPAKIEYEVPPHEPIPEDAKRPCTRRIDHTTTMDFMEELK